MVKMKKIDTGQVWLRMWGNWTCHTLLVGMWNGAIPQETFDYMHASSLIPNSTLGVYGMLRLAPTAPASSLGTSLPNSSP